jgi:hypothetical protein
LLAVLDSFSVANAELTLTDISRRTGLAVTTTHSKGGRGRHGDMVGRRPHAAAREIAAASGDRHP